MPKMLIVAVFFMLHNTVDMMSAIRIEGTKYIQKYHSKMESWFVVGTHKRARTHTHAHTMG